MFSIERKRLAGFQPGHSFLFFKDTTELFRFSLLVNVLLQLGNFQVIPEKA